MPVSVSAGAPWATKQNFSSKRVVGRSHILPITVPLKNWFKTEKKARMVALSKLVLFLVHRRAVLDLRKCINVAEPGNTLDGDGKYDGCPWIITYRRSPHESI